MQSSDSPSFSPIPHSSFRIPHSLHHSSFIIPHSAFSSAFRIHHSSFRILFTIPHSSFRIQHSAFQPMTNTPLEGRR